MIFSIEFIKSLKVLGCSHPKAMKKNISALRNYPQEFEAHYGCGLEVGMNLLNFLTQDNINIYTSKGVWLPSQSFLDINKLQLFKNFKQVPDSILFLRNLESLSIYGKIKKLPSYVFFFKKLESLYLHDNELTTLPEGLACLENLITLDLSSNKFENFPSVILEMKNLEELYLHSNHLKTIPIDVNRLKKMKTLVLAQNNIECIPHVNELTELIELDISHNKITHIPPLENKLKLECLLINNNQLTALPEGLNSCNSLEIIDISNNQNIETYEGISNREL